ncbi:MAG: radical SAM family heme chaperone HemW [Pseudomonadota bacterium]
MFGVYVHWPFCAAKCPYCDFNSHVRRSEIDQRIYARALAQEIAEAAERMPDRKVTSVFFGGGTPSLMEVETVATVINAISKAWPTANDVEISLEANPTSVEASRFKGYFEAGVNRVSLGVQALNDVDLRALGRQHSAEEALDALSVARDSFDRVSFDLIYARSGQTLADWERELNQALALGPDHVSLYQLTIEPGTPFYDRHARGRLIVPDDDAAADMYDLTQMVCTARGLPSYEISNHAKPGSECRHNLTYWRLHDFAGIGPGAHGRETRDNQRYASLTKKSPEQWLETVEKDGTGMTEYDPIDLIETGDEYLVMSLRLREGLSLSRYGYLTGRALPESAIAPLIDIGLLERDGDRLRATDAGRPVLNSVAAELSQAIEDVRLAS